MAGAEPHPSGDSPPEVLGVTVGDSSWFTRVDPGLRLSTGTPAKDVLRVPVDDALRLLRETARDVVGIPAGAAPAVVLTSGSGELLVRTGGLTLACAPGLVTIAVPVTCDQIPGGAPVTVPFAVGTEARPAGLVMSTLRRPDGPALVVDGWGPALTAFAWEALLHLAQALCAAAGADWAGDPLVPGYLSAAKGVLIVAPMARHRDPLPIKGTPLSGRLR